MRAAIIGGTGIYGLEGEQRRERVDTPYGGVEVSVQKAGDREVVFLPRHGRGHATPPHKINFRANLWALKELAVTHIFATNAVGSAHPHWWPGELVIFQDFLDFTKARPLTFYDGGDQVVHLDVSEPYCPVLRKLLQEKAPAHGLSFAGEAVYCCTEGPRFETAAEIRMYRQLGAHVVGMTGVPEVVLARELGICYAGVGIISNFCTGMSKEMTTEEILEAVERNKPKLTRLFLDIITHSHLSQEQCRCNRSLLIL
ncbi:MAG: S-methyl-5'-thioinosine phosphorylase [Clostridia bacterium]|jgi:5'-methylthioadenosine phosphorylase|nr:S-methyl-5'-thioinosine phosphorylase [Clostridia bacterium]